jgi:hypothetical protein
MGFDPRPRRYLRNFYATQYTEPQRVAVAQLAMRAAAGSGRWQPEQIQPGRLVDHAVEAGRASECASSALELTPPRRAQAQTPIDRRSLGLSVRSPGAPLYKLKL